MSNHRIVPISLVTLSVAAIALTSCSGGAPEQASSSGGAQLSVNEEARALLPQEIRDKGELTFATTANNAPFTMKPGEELGGMIPELGEELGAVLGVKISFEPMSFPGLIPAMEAERVNGIWTLMGATKSREETMEMVSYMKNSSGFMTLADRNIVIDDLDDLCTLHLATVRGGINADFLKSTADDCETKGLPRPEISLYDDPGAAQTQLRAGKIDAFSGITVPLRYVAQRVDNGKVFTVAKLQYLGGAQAIALPNGRDNLAQAIQAALREVVKSGRYKENLGKYNAENETLTADQIVINPATSGVLDDVVGTNEKERS